MKQNNTITIRLSDDTKDALSSLAGKDGRTLSAYIRFHLERMATIANGPDATKRLEAIQKYPMTPKEAFTKEVVDVKRTTSVAPANKKSLKCDRCQYKVNKQGRWQCVSCGRLRP